MEQQPPTNTRQKADSGFGVAASPFNGVKLELAIILILGVSFWLVLDSITNNDIAQIGLLLLFGVIGAGRLVVRTRSLMVKNNNQSL
ncbi:MAG: hypothetical protein GXP08_15265 [Gammaproteobacteria bacterium]|nr:hypothetical protein [Gammaproteobacteria bacterium]